MPVEFSDDPNDWADNLEEDLSDRLEDEIDRAIRTHDTEEILNKSFFEKYTEFDSLRQMYTVAILDDDIE